MKNIKRFLSVLLAIALCFSLVPCMAFAEGEILIQQANATVTEPEKGGHPDLFPISGDEEKYSVSVNYWYFYEEPYPYLNEQSTFESGCKYALRVVFTPQDGYKFNNDTVFTINGKSTCSYGADGMREIIFDLPREVFDVASAYELKQALNMSTPVKAINITADFTVNDDCMIYLDPEHINNYCDTVVTINKGVTLTVGNGGMIGSFWPSYEGDWQTPPLPNSVIINNGTVIIEDGGCTEADFDTSNGTIVIKEGGSAVCCNVNNGTVTIESGATYATSQGLEAVNRGTVTINEGALMQSRFGSAIVNEEGGVINLNGEFMCGCINYDGIDYMWFNNMGEVNGHGSVILYEATQERPVSDMDAAIETMMRQLGQETRFDNWDDINIIKMVTVSSYEELESALTGERVVAGEQVEGDMDVLIVLADSIVVPEGGNISTMAMMIIPEGTSVTVSDGGRLECGIENLGSVIVEQGGKLYTTMGGYIRNNHEMVIAEGGELKSQMGSSVINAEGASLLINGEFLCGCIGFDGDDGYWFENGGELKGTGFITLYEADRQMVPVSDMDALVEKLEAEIQGAGDPLPQVRKMSHIPGDINNDGAVNNKDLTRLFQYLSDWDVAVNEAALDVNGDGKANNKDLTRLFQYLSDWDVEIC